MIPRQISAPPVIWQVFANARIFHTPDVSAFEVTGTTGQPDVSLQLLSAVVEPGAQPFWLRLVERRIENSVASEEHQAEEPGRWLSESVANAGLEFFQNSADLLPSEPFIYSSQNGNLVAEFKGVHGTLTTVVSADSTILFATIGEKFFEKRLDPRKDKSGTVLRDELRKIKRMLRTGGHGSVESSD